VSEQVYALAAVRPARYPGFIVGSTEHMDGREAFRGACYRLRLSCPITGLNRPSGFQEIKAPRFLDIDT
jgi:hypothetical protein